MSVLDAGFWGVYSLMVAVFLGGVLLGRWWSR
jgi:hypothetical protein